MRLDDFRIATKLWGVVGALLLAMFCIGAYGLFEMRATMLADYQTKTRNIAEAAHSVATDFHGRIAKGEMRETDAKAAAIAALRAIRYDGEEYVWINDMNVVIVMHPIKPELEGKDMSGSTDPSGKKLFVAFVDAVKRSGEGFVDYLWPKPGHSEPVPKISYVKGFAPWGWVIGSGVYVDSVDALFRRQALFVGIVLLAVAGVVGAFAAVIVRSTSKPLVAMCKTMGRLSHDDLNAEVEEQDRHDEIGEIARAVQVFKDGLIRAKQLAAEQERSRAGQLQRAKTIEGLTQGFDRDSSQVIRSLGDAVNDMEETAGGLSEQADQTTQRAAAVAAAAEQASANVQTVASAAEELSASIAEISHQVSEAARVSREASDEAHRTDKLVSGLAEAAGRIGDVVKLITDIASQTNLLALNATIEAARAGDAGKGFAVVAGEVKNLANQTARATDEISSQITAVQGATREAVSAIQGIAGTIERISEISSAIASAVEEQGAATQEIARNVSQAATGTQEVTGNIESVSDAAANAKQTADHVLDLARGLSSRSQELSGEVEQFLSGVKAA